jgi:crotonobetainyl-CoA:carnitine CoA-transferase CaiB-like acyl-CoA transferase
VKALLDGIRVIDLSRVLAGPFTAQILAEMGADVIKVEPPGGDMARGIGPFLDGRSLYFSALNTGKRGVVLDLTTGPGRRGLDALLSAADIVVENYRPGAVDKLGLRPEDLLAAHPHLVIVTISGYSRNSTRAQDGAYDLVAQAESGIMAVTGEPGGAPVRAGVAISDLAAGLWGALGAVAAYAARTRDGAGRHVEVPLLDSAMSLLTYVATAAASTGIDPDQVGSGHHNIVPYRAFATTDGWVVVAVIGDKFWPALCAAFDFDGGGEDLRTNPDRVAHRARVDGMVAQAIGRFDTAEALRRLARSGVPHAPIHSVLDALTSPYVQSGGMVAEVEAAEGSYQVVQGPLRTGAAPRPAPALGEHSREVMTEALGADSPDLAAIVTD